MGEFTTNAGFTHAGELLQVDDGGVLILRGESEVVSLSWQRIRDAEVGDFSIEWRAGFPPEGEDLDLLSRISRFPPGLSDAQLEELLGFYGQDAVIVIGTTETASLDVNATEFIEQVHETALRFQSIEEATLGGYRMIGPDFPGMGQHWVNTYILMRDGVDPTRPPLLSYLTTPTGVRLTGVAFGQILLDADESGDLPFPSAWHEHSETLDEELLALNPDAAHQTSRDEVRLSMLHVWTGLENPDGIFSQDNWAVPFARLGLPIPENPSPEAGKSLFLASGGDKYYLGLLQSLVTLDEAEESAVVTGLATHREAVTQMIDEDRLSGLAGVWVSLWSEIKDGIRQSHWERVQLLAR